MGLEGRKHRGFLSLFFVAIFILYFYLAYNTPLTHDDWTWATSDGMDRLKNWFKDYNGRYLGNIIEIVLTRVYLKRIFIMALFSTLLVILTAYRSKENPALNYILSLLLFLTVPVNMISQTYAWVAGFSNYITSIVLVLIYLAVIRNIFEAVSPKYKIWMTLAVIPLGIATTLIVEHVTIYVIVMALYVIIFSFIKFRKFYYLHISYLISVIIGAAIMFSNGAYSKIMNGNDQYRSIDTKAADVGFFQKISDVYSEQMYPFLFSNNVVLNLFISLLCIILLVMHKEKLGIFKKIMQNILIFVFTLYPFYKPLVLDTFHISFFEVYPNGFEAVFSLIFYVSILLTVILFIKDKSLIHKLLFYLLSAIVLAGPLIFVTPFGPRCFIASYTFFAMFVIEISMYISTNNFVHLQKLNKLFVMISILVTTCYVYVFTMNNIVHRERIHYIHQQVNKHAKVIELTRLPYPQFLWISTPYIPGYQYETFKRFYHIPADTDLKIISYTDWVNKGH